uniref:Uncharacterized protein n=1 Tax=Rhizophora mucronata TaxID=61149 RepID=A0A2P2NLX7_RHIMU
MGCINTNSSVLLSQSLLRGIMKHKPHLYANMPVWSTELSLHVSMENL